MNIFTVSLFRHRWITNPSDIETALIKEIGTLIRSKEYIEFLVGRNGEFDLLAASVIRRVQNSLAFGNSALILVLPCITAEYRKNTDALESYYDEIEICGESADCHFKSAFQARNHAMVDRSDLIICYIEHQSGGAFQTVQYAQKQNKKVINLAEVK